MSAILGRVEYGSRTINANLFKSAFATLEHYGHGESEAFLTDTVAAGAHNFATSQSFKQSSFFKSAGDHIVIADAILDNREELAAVLGLAASDIKPISNAELISLSFEKWGTNCVKYLEGDFAFVCISLKAKSVFLARDHIGSRPLFWSIRENTLLFGTSIESIIHFDDFDWKIDEEMVAEYLAYPLAPVSKPFFVDVFAVPVGSYIQTNGKKATTRQWWTPSTKPRAPKKSKQAIIDECTAELNRAIARRCETSLPVGSHISGGMDSTGVTMLASRALRAQGSKMIGCYTWAPEVSDAYPIEHSRDERLAIKSLSDDESIAVNYGGANAADMIDFMHHPIEYFNETDLADEIPILRKAQTDRAGIILSGWGGDEVFSAHGVGYFGHLVYSGQFMNARRLAHHRQMGLRNPATLLRLAWRELIHPLLPTAVYQRLHFVRWLGNHTSNASRNLRKKYATQFAKRSNFTKMGLNPIDNLKRHLLIGHVTMRMESWAAWSAQYGFQYRYPLTDKKFIEYLLRLSPNQVFLDSKPRGLAHAVFAEFIPATAGKIDYANETARQNARFGAWEALAQAVKDGEFDDDCPWIDGAEFKAHAVAPKEQTDSANVKEFLGLFAATRVWSMYRRAKKSGWV